MIDLFERLFFGRVHRRGRRSSATASNGRRYAFGVPPGERGELGAAIERDNHRALRAARLAEPPVLSEGHSFEAQRR